MTDPETIRTLRSLLRRVDDHDQAVALEEGARRESLNMLDVVYHPTNPLPTLNYLTPRRGAAWVSTNAVQDGLYRLAELGRAPRLLYLEGLMPPIFRQSLESLGLQLAGESQIYACAAPDSVAASDTGFVVTIASQTAALLRWWYARSYILAGGIQRQTDGMIVERMRHQIEAGRACFLELWHGMQTIGVASLRLQPALHSAEVSAFHLSTQDEAAAKVLMAEALHVAAAAGCDLVFVAEALADDHWLQELQFMSLGSVVAFAARVSSKVNPDDRLAESLHP